MNAEAAEDSHLKQDAEIRFKIGISTLDFKSQLSDLFPSASPCLLIIFKERPTGYQVFKYPRLIVDHIFQYRMVQNVHYYSKRKEWGYSEEYWTKARLKPAGQIPFLVNVITSKFLGDQKAATIFDEMLQWDGLHSNVSIVLL